MTFKYLLSVAVFFSISIFAVANVHASQECAVSDSGHLWLINRDSMLCADYVPNNLCKYKGVHVRAVASNAFTQMLAAMESDDIYGLRLQSAYRTYGHQRTIFDRKKQELSAKGYSEIEAESTASMSIHPPGASEHQLGLALDVATDGTLTQAFGETKAGKWLEENCHTFGFIIRYPNLKTDITKIVYEPWHLRYVGVPHSTIMKNLNLTLEEYLLYIKQVKTYMFWAEDTDYFLVCYSHSLPSDLPPQTVDVSSLSPSKSEYIITLRKTYPDVWESTTEKGLSETAP